MATTRARGLGDKGAHFLPALLLLIATSCAADRPQQNLNTVQSGTQSTQPQIADLSPAREYVVFDSNCRLVHLGGGQFEFNPVHLRIAGNYANVTIGAPGVGLMTVHQRAHIAMKAASEIQKATGAESVLLYLALGEGLPKITTSVATVAYEPQGKDWNDGRGRVVWDVEVSDIQVAPEAISLAQQAGRRGEDVALPIPNIYRKKYDPSTKRPDPTPAGPQQALTAQLFQLVDRLVPEEQEAHSYNVEMAKQLISKGADVNARDQSETPLIRAAQNGHVRVIEVLLAHGADVNAQDDVGHTALMKAANFSDARMTKLLLSKGADPNLKDKYGWTALGMLEGASEPGTAETRRLLKRAGGTNHQGQ